MPRMIFQNSSCGAVSFYLRKDAHAWLKAEQALVLFLTDLIILRTSLPTKRCPSFHRGVSNDKTKSHEAKWNVTRGVVSK